MPSLLLHIGLPKTGSTYLQEAVFPYLPGLRYLGKLETDRLQPPGGPHYGLLDRFFQHAAAIWDGLGDGLFAEHIGRAPEDVRGALISDEGIGAAAWRPEHMEVHLGRLMGLATAWGYGPVRIACAIRRQDQWLGSHYAQRSDRNAAASQADFEAYVRDFVDPEGRYYKAGVRLDYYGLWQSLTRALGPEHVLMVPFERLEREPHAYLNAFIGFLLDDPSLNARALGLDVEPHNRRSSGEDRWAIRSLQSRRVRLRPTRLFATLGLPTMLRLPYPSRPREVVMTPALRQAVLERYGPRNRALADTLGTDLAAYGYYDSKTVTV